MRYRKASDGTEVPVIGLGTYGIGGGSTPDPARDDEYVQALHRAFDLGYRHLDTAEVYAQGHSEEVIGKALQGRPRQEFFITTKVDPAHLRYDDFMRSLDSSLRRLQTDYVDLYLIHWPSDTIPIAEAFRGMNAAVKDKTVRHVGVSNFSVEQMREARQESDVPIITNQVPYSLDRRDYVNNGVLSFCREEGILLTAYSPIKGSTISKAVVREVAEKHQCAEAQIALAWLLNQDAVITIPKAVQLPHLRENMAALDVKLDEEDVRRLDAAV